MAYGVGRDEVVDEASAHEYGWVLGDISCYWLNAKIAQALEKENQKIYVKGCEHAGLAIEAGKAFMEVECPANCLYRR